MRHHCWQRALRLRHHTHVNVRSSNAPCSNAPWCGLLTPAAASAGLPTRRRAAFAAEIAPGSDFGCNREKEHREAAGATGKSALATAMAAPPEQQLATLSQAEALLALVVRHSVSDAETLCSVLATSRSAQAAVRAICCGDARRQRLTLSIETSPAGNAPAFVRWLRTHGGLVSHLQLTGATKGAAALVAALRTSGGAASSTSPLALRSLVLCVEDPGPLLAALSSASLAHLELHLRPEAWPASVAALAAALAGLPGLCALCVCNASSLGADVDAALGRLTALTRLSLSCSCDVGVLPASLQGLTLYHNARWLLPSFGHLTALRQLFLAAPLVPAQQLAAAASGLPGCCALRLAYYERPAAAEAHAHLWHELASLRELDFSLYCGGVTGAIAAGIAAARQLTGLVLVAEEGVAAGVDLVSTLAPLSRLASLHLEIGGEEDGEAHVGDTDAGSALACVLSGGGMRGITRLHLLDAVLPEVVHALLAGGALPQLRQLAAAVHEPPASCAEQLPGLRLDVLHSMHHLEHVALQRCGWDERTDGGDDDGAHAFVDAVARAIARPALPRLRRLVLCLDHPERPLADGDAAELAALVAAGRPALQVRIEAESLSMLGLSWCEWW